MTTTAAVHRNDAQADGRQYVVFEFTHTASGSRWLSGVHRLAAGVDPDALGAALAPEHEVRRVQEERDEAYSLAIAGGDPDLMALDFNTLAVIRKYVFRRIFNLMRDDIADPAKAQVCINLSAPSSYMNKHTNPQIAGFVDDPAWSTPTVNGATSAISAVGVNMAQLDHGESELALDF